MADYNRDSDAPNPVQYTSPMVPTYSHYNGATSSFPTVSPSRRPPHQPGPFQYAHIPPESVRYTTEPVIQPPPSILHTATPVGSSKYDKESTVINSHSPFAPAPLFKTVEPGPPSKSKKKRKDKTNPSLPLPPPLPPGIPGLPPSLPSASPIVAAPRIPVAASSTYPVAASSTYPVATPSHHPIAAPSAFPIATQHADGTQIVDIAPPSESLPKSLSSHRLSAPGPPPNPRALSPDGLRRRVDRLSVSGDRSSAPGMPPPPSPLLEPYRGTYQSMPGFPSPMLHGRDGHWDDDGLEDLESLSPRHSSRQVDRVDIGRSGSFSIKRTSGRSTSPKKPKKTVSMYEAERDAAMIAGELTRSKPDFRVLTDVLPSLSHDQMLELHAAYKRVARYRGHGINIAKHIKLKVPGHLGTVAYVTALGRWESEGYWANYWYQSAVAKRELLIEALMGRSNFEMQMIKEHFRDRRYGSSLVRCMDKELRADKFRSAIMLALDAKRQEENEVFPIEYVERDVRTWARALRMRTGGESDMLEICVTRSDRHLKECLRMFERREGGNFAKLALARSENLVGEVIAHILNGVINRPARDAMLVHHALLDLKPLSKGRRGSSGSSRSSKDNSPRSSMTKLNPFSSERREEKREKMVEREDRKVRYELLISRLVRLHWDKRHLQQVKETYHDKYGSYVEEDVEDWVKGGEFMEYCLELLTPN